MARHHCTCLAAFAGAVACATPPPAPLPAPEPPPVAANAPPELSPREEADAAWDRREERASLERAIALWTTEVDQRGADPALLIRLAQANLRLAEWFVAPEGDLHRTRAVLERGIDAAERAILMLAPDFGARVAAGEAPEAALATVPEAAGEALLWYGANLWRYVATDLRTATVYRPRVEAALTRALAIDPTLAGAAPHRWLGILRARLPSMAGGDLPEAKAHFDEALRLAPGYLDNKVQYAEHYAREARDHTLWLRLLTEVAASPSEQVAGLEPEQRRAFARAQLLLSHVDEVF